MKSLAVFFIILAFNICKGQGTQTRIIVPITSGTDSALLQLPDDYNTTSKIYPLLVFCNGSGEAQDGGSPGNGLAKLYNSTTAGGPANLIAQGKWPSAILNPKDGNLYKFIVITIQAKSGGGNGDDLDVSLSYLVKTYRVDITRIYIMGISLGGGAAMEFASRLDPNETVVTHTRKNLIAGALLLSGATLIPQKSWAIPVVSDSIHVEAFADPNNDTYGENDMNYIGYINATRSGFALFVPNNYGHGGWSNIYLPSFLIPGLNINVYQWLLQFKAKGSVIAPPPTLPPLITKITADSTTINSPNSIVRLNTDSSKNAIGIGQSWMQLSGPTNAIFTPGMGTTMFVSGLFPGTYKFQASMMDSSRFSQDSITITVNPVKIPPCPTCPPPIVCPAPRTVTGFTFTIVNGAPTFKFTYSDGNP